MAIDLDSLMPQQLDIVTTLDRRLFVSAGAGSGKTFTLTRRILWALSPESGPFAKSLDEVLAITFTKDAAAEIRERVRGALIKAGMAREALAVDDAWISTIHGMCARILRATALELGIDPEFQVLTDTDELMGCAVDQVIAAAEGDYQELFSWYDLDTEGFNGTSVRMLVRRLLELASASKNGFDDIKLLRGTVDLSHLASSYGDLLRNGGPKGKETARDALAAIEAFEASGRTRDDLVACMMTCKVPRAGGGFGKDAVAALKAEFADTFVNAYLACGGAALDQLLELSRRVFDAYQELKAARSYLDNNDLLRMTYLALRDHADIRAAYADRFKMVMIDEFQDTDQQQVDLIDFLAGEGSKHLCTVGDAQQSIYRFRGADVQVFRSQQKAVEEAEATDGSAHEVELVRNFRSHAEVLDYVARVFDGAAGGIMKGFMDLEPKPGRKDGLKAQGQSHRQALLVAGGTVEDRARAKAQAIAERFRALVDAGQPAGGMVILLGGMPRAGIYADAIRAQGLDCVISGGSVFADTLEARTVRALVWTLANPLDARNGLMPLLQSSAFALGAEEFLALATSYDSATGETSRRNIDQGLMSDDDAPGMGDSPLLTRARTVMRRALARVGKDSLADIARDVVSESGWLVRLEARGAEGKAAAANALKALDALSEVEAETGNSPRLIARGFDRFLQGKEAPGALNEGGSGAVRIMTVHASKGLEFPVVAVSECFGIRANTDKMQARRKDDGTLEVAALPAAFAGARGFDGIYHSSKDIKKQFDSFFGGASPWLTLSSAAEACATGSVAEEWLFMRDEEEKASLEERQRLLYVAMTRAKELCLLAMDSGVSAGKDHALAVAPVEDSSGDKGKDGKSGAEKPKRDFTYDVLKRILPADAAVGAQLAADHLAFDTARKGDYEFIALADFKAGGVEYVQNAEIDGDGRLVRFDAGDAKKQAASARDEKGGAAVGGIDLVDDAHGEDSFTLVVPAAVDVVIAPAQSALRDSFSYSSVAAALHEEGEDRVLPSASQSEASGGDLDEIVMPETSPSASDGAAAARQHDGDPTALGSALHAACQWLIETSASTVPVSRRDALARTWHITASQRVRLDVAIARWEASAVRVEALAWPRQRAEVPFFAPGKDDLVKRFGAYMEGAIDLLCDDPEDLARGALVIDYKTGGDPSETPEQLQQKHALQASIYADVLHKMGYGPVTLKFVRLEIPDSDDPAQPQVVTYRYESGAFSSQAFS